MDPRLYWKTYVKRHGGVPATAKHLGLPYSTVASVTNGTRGIGRDLALRMAEADPLLDPSVLFYVRPVLKLRSQPRPARAARKRTPIR